MVRQLIQIGKRGTRQARRVSSASVDLRRRSLKVSVPVTFGPGRERSGAPSVTPEAYVHGSC